MTYKSRSGHDLVGILSSPEDALTVPRKVVVLVHGGMANKNSFYHKQLAQLVRCATPFNPNLAAANDHAPDYERIADVCISI